MTCNRYYKRTIVLATALSLATVGCVPLQSTDPYTGEARTNRASIGAGAGALAGALLGSTTSSKKHRGRSALIGAGIGALAGGLVGKHIESQEAALRQRLRNTGVSVQRLGDRIKLIMPGNITFKTGSANINANFYPVLNSVAVVLKKYKRTLVNIAGFTDNTGSSTFNDNLSVNRANSVAAYLRSQGIDPLRLSSVGYGERHPIASNSSTASRQMNRRVEITLRPLPA